MQHSLYTHELADIISIHLNCEDSLLDIGTGELTTLSPVVSKLRQMPSHIFACDISWSRIYKGMRFALDKMEAHYNRLIPFVADINELPLKDKSIDITISSHGLEPNGSTLSFLMSELFRVTVKKCVLFEPCYEINTDEGKRRMDSLGYIKDVEGVVQKCGGKLIDRTIIKNTNNPLNPTACFVIRPPVSSTPKSISSSDDIFSVPGSDYSLKKIDTFYFSNYTGLCFPILKSIPILRSDAAILASALCM